MRLLLIALLALPLGSICATTHTKRIPTTKQATPTEAATAQSEKPYEYQGNVLGVTTFEQWKAAGHSATYCTEYQWANTCDLFRADPANGIYMFVDGKLAQVYLKLSGDSPKPYVQALTSKLGRPVETTTPLQNRFGAKFIGQMWVWTNSTSKIQLNGFGESQDRPTLTYSDTKLSATMEQRWNPAPKL